MGNIRKHHRPEFKSKVALDAIKEVSTISEIASNEGVHPNQVGQWKKEAIEYLKDAFKGKKAGKEKELENVQSELYRKIGQLEVELDWLKKKSGVYR